MDDFKKILGTGKRRTGHTDFNCYRCFKCSRSFIALSTSSATKAWSGCSLVTNLRHFNCLLSTEDSFRLFHRELKQFDDDGCSKCFFNETVRCNITKTSLSHSCSYILIMTVNLCYKTPFQKKNDNRKHPEFSISQIEGSVHQINLAGTHFPRSTSRTF